MKTKRLAIAIGALFVASAGATAYAQTTPHQTPEQMPPSASTASMSGARHANRPMSSDSIIRQVKQELMSRGVTATNVSVTFQDGTAILTGTVATQGDIGKARAAALRVKGVKHVDTSGLQARAQTGQDQGGG